MKKLIALLGATAMVLTCFTGCGEKNAEELNDIANGLYKGVNSSLTELDEEGINVGGSFWFDSDRNISDTASEDILSHTEDLYSKVSNFYSDSGLYEWVMYCEGGTVEEAYAAESFDSKVVGYFSHNEDIDIEGKNLNDIKQGIDNRVIEENKEEEIKITTTISKEEKAEITTANKSNKELSIEKFEKRFDEMFKQLCIDYFSTDYYMEFYEPYKLAEKTESYTGDGDSALISYKYGSNFNLVINTDTAGDIGSVVVMSRNIYLSDSTIDDNPKLFFLTLNFLPYIVVNDNYDLDDLDNFRGNIIDNAEDTAAGIRAEYSDSNYEYTFSTELGLETFTIGRND